MRSHLLAAAGIAIGLVLSGPGDAAAAGIAGMDGRENPLQDPAISFRSIRNGDSQAAAPAIGRDPARLPAAVRALRAELMNAARSGDIERLRPIIERQPRVPIFSFGHQDEPILFLRSGSGDEEGRETLAILLEVLEAGYIHVDPGEPGEMYVWPYFAHYPVNALTPPQTVELFKIITGRDYEDMLAVSAYLFFRLGIAPDGTWRFFVAGD